MFVYLGNEVIVKKDIGWSSQHGVGGGVLGLGLQEGVWGEPGHRDMVELWLQVYQGHCHLKKLHKRQEGGKLGRREGRRERKGRNGGQGGRKKNTAHIEKGGGTMAG